MKEYMYIFRGGDQGLATKTPEEFQVHMQKWQTWMQDLADSGNLLSGQPLMSSGKTILEDGSKVIDRPLAEGKELIGGYLLVKTNNEEEAIALAKGCPIFEHDGTLEMREISEMKAHVDYD